jgi:O-antigen/teichoic acid export membrane protein
MGILYNEHVSISSEVFIRLIYAFVFISTSYIFGTLLTANGSLMQLNLLASITVVLNVCLNLVLIPRFKVIGAAWASIISQGFYAVSQIILARKIFSLKTHSSYSYRLVGLALCLLVTSFLLFISGIHWYISFFAICISGILFSWILRILTPGEVIKIVRSAE